MYVDRVPLNHHPPVSHPLLGPGRPVDYALGVTAAQ